jgi:hypothetical protein
MASATAANAVALTSSPTTLFDPGTNNKPRAWTIFNDAASAGYALVNVAGIHTAGEFVGIPPGASMTFADTGTRIGVVTAKAVTTATISHGIAALN